MMISVAIQKMLGEMIRVKKTILHFLEIDIPYDTMGIPED
jgi:hypothetical protein